VVVGEDTELLWK